MMGSINLYGLTVSNATLSTLGLFIHKLNVAEGGSLNGGAINIDGNKGVFNWRGGTLIGTYGFLAGSTVNIFGSAKTLGGGGTILNNAGTINWTNGAIYNYGYNISDVATFNNQSNATFNLYGDGHLFLHDYNPSLFNNLAGARFIKASGTGTNTISDWTFNNGGNLEAVTGTLEVTGTTLNLSGGSIESGAIICDNLTTMNVQGSTTITNGVVTIQNATIHGEPNSSISTPNGTLEWSSGNLDGVVEIAPESGLLLDGDVTRTFNAGAVLRNLGTVYWTGLGNIYNYAYYDGTEATILNLNGGLFYLASDAQITSDYHAAYFTNYPGATFMKIAGTGTNIVNWLVDNHGLITSRSGAIAFNAGGTSSGEFSTFAGASVRFTGGIHSLASNTLFSGGDIQIDGGTVTRTGTINGGASSPTTLDFISGQFDGVGSLAQHFTMNWTGGTVGGQLDLGSAVTVNITGTATKSFGDGAQMNNFGIVNWSGPGQIHNYGYYDGTQATFNNQSNAVFNLLTDGGVFWQEYNRSYFTNFPGGVVAKITGAGTNVLNGFGIENFGEIRASTGTIQFPDLLDLNAGSALTGNGTVVFSGNVDMNAPVSNSGNIVVDAGILTGAISTNGAALSSYSGTGAFNWTGGTMAGRFVLAPGTSINITGDNTKTLGSGAFVDNFGTINWSGPGKIYNYGYSSDQPATINNYSNAVFNLLTDGAVFTHEYFESYFTNFPGGLVAKTTGSGTNFLDSFLFENSGEVQVQTGQIVFDDFLDLFPGSKFTGGGAIHFAGNVSLYGTMQGNAATIAFDSQNFNGVAGSNATYTGTSPFTWNAGTLNGSLTVQSGSTMNIIGSSDKTMGFGAVLNNAGTVNWTGPGRIYNNAYNPGQQAAINNMPNANFNLLTDGEVFIHDYNPSWFTNQAGAHFTKVAGDGTNVIHAFTMYDFGEVRAQSGTIQFTEALDINQAAMFTGGGASQLANGTATLHGQMDVNGSTFQVVGGTFTGDVAGNPSIGTENNGAFEWAGGSLSGTLRMLPGSSMNITGDATKIFNAGTVLNNAGAILWSGNGTLYNNAYNDGQQAVINNLSGALINVVGGGSFTHDYNVSTIYNNSGATFRKTAGADTSCNWNFNNNGTIDLRTGNFINTGLSLGSNGVVNLTLTGTNSNAQLTQSGALTFAGGLNLINTGWPLTNGLSFTLANYTSPTGQFSPLTLPSLPQGSKWTLTYGPTTLTAAVVSATVLSAPSNDGHGGFQLTLNGEPASAAILQTSLDLNTWTSVSTNAPFTGTFDFNDTPLPGETNKFYRILIVP